MRDDPAGAQHGGGGAQGGDFLQLVAGVEDAASLGGQSAQLGSAGAAEEGVQPSYVERGQDSWRGYLAWVPRGRFTVQYALRLNGAGQLQLPPTRVVAMYSPEIRAAVPNRPVTVSMR